MDRLTELHHKKSDGYYIRCSEHCNNDICDCGCEKFEQIVNRLGAYEDTGMEPCETNEKYATITSEGVVDVGYTGSICVKLYNHGDISYAIHRGDKISQLVIVPVVIPPIKIVDSLEDTERGDQGFGSTGR